MGPALCLLSAACFGTMGVFGKLAYDSGVLPEALLLLRFTMAAALLATLLVLRPGLRVRPGAPAPSGSPARMRRPVLTALGLGAVGYATPSTLYFSALTRIDASLVALLLYTYPALVTLAAALLGRDRLTPARTAALVVASCGTLLVLVGAGAPRFEPTGVALAMAAALTYTVYVIVADTAVHQLPPVVLATLVMTGAALALTGRAVLTSGVSLHLGAAGWLWVTSMTIVSTVVGMLAFFAGLRRTGPSTASILSTLEPVTTTTLAALVLHEHLTPVQLAGALLVLGSVAVVQLRPPAALLDERPGPRADAGRVDDPTSPGPSPLARPLSPRHGHGSTSQSGENPAALSQQTAGARSD